MYTKRTKYLTIISLLLATVFILAALYIDSQDYKLPFNISILLSSVGYSIIASTIFAFIYKSKTDEYIEEKLIGDIRDNIENKLEILFLENRLLSNEHPKQIFPATDIPNPEFNELIDTNIIKSTFYRFKGARALYLSYRLKESVSATPLTLKIEIVLFGMENESELRHRAKTMKGLPEYSKKTIEQIMSEMTQELLAVLVAFYDIRQQHNFEIFFSDELLPFRFEIMDDLLIVSASVQRGKKFPATFIYSKGSAFYDSYITYFDLQKELAYAKERMTSQNISEEMILTLAKKLGNQSTVEELRKFYESKHKKFKNK